MRNTALCTAVVLLALAGAGTAEARTVRNVTGKADERLLITSTTLDDSGSFVYSLTNTDDHGTNARLAFQIERFDTVTGSATGITGYRDGVTDAQVSDDGQWLALLSPGNLTGSNHDESAELHVLETDGTSLQQLTDDDDILAADVVGLAFAGSGNRIAFWSRNDPPGVDPSKDGRMQGCRPFPFRI